MCVSRGEMPLVKYMFYFFGSRAAPFRRTQLCMCIERASKKVIGIGSCNLEHLPNKIRLIDGTAHSSKASENDAALFIVFWVFSTRERLPLEACYHHHQPTVRRLSSKLIIRNDVDRSETQSLFIIPKYVVPASPVKSCRLG